MRKVLSAVDNIPTMMTKGLLRGVILFGSIAVEMTSASMLAAPVMMAQPAPIVVAQPQLVALTEPVLQVSCPAVCSNSANCRVGLDVRKVTVRTHPKCLQWCLRICACARSSCTLHHFALTLNEIAGL